ncbi:c1710061-06ce-4022-a898-04e316b96be2 [Sclerotinia trifoliorum]|uniref:C1710061-06ce-4022-a898-04e316b96be2 n=1 Tax=Sclerotinia trifoliorum TaxID=28548 RepID=A0A8H2ZN54_9HELO|nr:c1710061-06ce-4022-a898-04e316b96be2 [Sclerotinia trifoliorum]
MGPSCSPLSSELDHEETLLEEYGKTPFNQRQRPKDPTISRYNALAIEICRLMIAVLFFAIIVLLSMVLTMARGASSHAGGLCPEALQQADLVHLGVSHHSHDSQTELVWKDCGGSGEEARAKGCFFDVILVAWLQPECFDSELHEVYLSDHDYPFWLDRSLQTPMTLEEELERPVASRDWVLSFAHGLSFVWYALRTCEIIMAWKAEMTRS